MALIGTVTEFGRYRKYVGIAGVDDEDIVIETVDISRFDTFMLSNAAGAVKVLVHDGTTLLTAPLSLADLGATTNDPVLLTAALRQYAFKGRFHNIQVRQEGVTDATGVVLWCFVDASGK